MEERGATLGASGGGGIAVVADTKLPLNRETGLHFHLALLGISLQGTKKEFAKNLQTLFKSLTLKVSL